MPWPAGWAREFSAPVGLLDPTTLIWRVRVGLDVAEFPEAGRQPDGSAGLGPALERPGLALARGSRTRARPGSACRSPRAEGPDLVAIVGFAAARPPRRVGDPPCPERALKAWGQSVADGLRGEAFARPGNAKPISPFRGEGGDRLLTARLIRPAQGLRPAREVPGPGAQRPPISPRRGGCRVGAKPRLRPGAGRRPRQGDGGARLPGPGPRWQVPTPSSSPTSRRREPTRRPVASSPVAADSQSPVGWVVAVNPVDDRPFGSTEVELIQPVASLIGTQRTNGKLYGEREGTPLRHHPRPDLGHRREGPLYLGPLRASPPGSPSAWPSRWASRPTSAATST